MGGRGPSTPNSHGLVAHYAKSVLDEVNRRNTCAVDV